jgi:hypothetical protein
MSPQTARLDLVANRWTDFVYVIAFQGMNMVGVGQALQIRLTRDTTGTALVALANAALATDEGLFMLDMSNQDVDFGGDIGVLNVPVTTMQIRILAATLNTLPFPAEIGDDVALFYDYVTSSFEYPDLFRILEGTFTVHAGVTQV